MPILFFAAAAPSKFVATVSTRAPRDQAPRARRRAEDHAARVRQAVPAVGVPRDARQAREAA